MERFRGIEGMRGWLALIVLLAHLVTATGFTSVVPGLAFLAPASGQAVTVFIIISGFVIAHLRLSRGEPYPLYIARRALRLYPVYLVCLLLGLAVQ
jgi:peptidoglycan/LPS O-acetylase OafA/YrhL